MYAKDIDKPVADVRYQMMTTKGTRFTPGKWWGDFTTSKDLKTQGEFIMEFEDGSRGEIFIYSNGTSLGKSGHYQFTFNGRGKLNGLQGRGMTSER